MIGYVIQLTLLRLWRARATVSCQVLALFAMMAPLLIILGLKYGIVESMKERLLSDPSSLEVRMLDAVKVTPELTERIRNWPETAFVTPKVAALYSYVYVCTEGAGENEEIQVEMLPTGEGDPLLQATQVSPPKKDEVVISESLAQELKVSAGDKLQLRMRRNMRQELFERTLTITGVLPKRNLMTEALLLPLAVTEEVEDFIISGRGIPGSKAVLMAELYDGIVLGEGRNDELANLLKQQRPNMEVHTNADGTFPAQPAESLIVSSTEGKLSPTQLDVLIAQAEQMGCEAWPWVQACRAELLVGQESRRVRVVALPGMTTSAAEIKAPPVVYVPKGSAAEHVEIHMQSPQGESRIVCCAVEKENVPQGEVRVAPQLLALVHYGHERCLVWDYRTDALRYPVLSHNSLRVYANSLEHAEPLMNRLQSEGISCRARLNIIRQILALEHSLTQLFAIVTLGAAAGALVSYALSLFNAAELNRRDYALVQLLGAGRGVLAFMPLVDALITSIVALALTFACFYATSSLIGLIFAESAGSGALCRLAPQHALLFCLSGVGVACLASIAAAIKVLRISPAEILRES